MTAGGRPLHGWALVSLELASLPVDEQAAVRAHLERERPEAVPLPLATSLEILGRTRHVAPELIHAAVHRVVRTHGKAPFASPAESAALDRVLHNTSGTSQAKFFSATKPWSPPPGGSWETPTCVCATVGVGAVDAQQVTLTFHTSRSVAEMAPYADPRRWPACSSFWQSMTPVSMTGTATDWAAPFDEKVELIPMCPMTTPLMFTYHETTNEVITKYYLLRETEYLDVDEGSITVSVDSNGPQGMPTKIVAVKTIHWLEKWLQGMPDLLCHTIWGELGVNMAQRCGL